MLDLYTLHSNPESLLGFDRKQFLSPEFALEYMFKHPELRSPELEQVLKQDPNTAYMYASKFLKHRWPEAEPIIMKSTNNAVFYAIYVIKGRWSEAEPYILHNLGRSVIYARDVLRHRWPELEKELLERERPGQITNYVEDVIKGPWPEAEQLLKTSRHYWKIYQSIVRLSLISTLANYGIEDYRIEQLKKEANRDEDGLTNRFMTIIAKHEIQGRWKEAEPFIKQDKKDWQKYIDVIKSIHVRKE